MNPYPQPLPKIERERREKHFSSTNLLIFFFFFFFLFIVLLFWRILILGRWWGRRWWLVLLVWWVLHYTWTWKDDQLYLHEWIYKNNAESLAKEKVFWIDEQRQKNRLTDATLLKSMMWKQSFQRVRKISLQIKMRWDADYQ